MVPYRYFIKVFLHFYRSDQITGRKGVDSMRAKLLVKGVALKESSGVVVDETTTPTSNTNNPNLNDVANKAEIMGTIKTVPKGWFSPLRSIKCRALTSSLYVFNIL